MCTCILFFYSPLNHLPHRYYASTFAMHSAHFRYSVTVFCKMVTNKPGKTTSGETQASQLVTSPRNCLFFLSQASSTYFSVFAWQCNWLCVAGVGICHKQTAYQFLWCQLSGWIRQLSIYSHNSPVRWPSLHRC